MDLVLLFGAVIIITALITFALGRRFGVLALALAAGSVLADIWASDVTGLLNTAGISLPGLPAGVLAEVLLLISPLVLLLLGGPRYDKRLIRVFSSLGVGLLVVAFLVQPLGEYMVLQGEALGVYQWLNEAQRYIVTVGLSLGIVDLLLTHSRKQKDNSKH